MLLFQLLFPGDDLSKITSTNALSKCKKYYIKTHPDKTQKNETAKTMDLVRYMVDILKNNFDDYLYFYQKYDNEIIDKYFEHYTHLKKISNINLDAYESKMIIDVVIRNKAKNFNIDSFHPYKKIMETKPTLLIDMITFNMAVIFPKFNKYEIQTYINITIKEIIEYYHKISFSEKKKIGALINAKDSNGKSALDYAISQKNIPLIQLLRDQGACINYAPGEDCILQKIFYEKTVYTNEDRKEILNALFVDLHTDASYLCEEINIAGRSGFTALHWAAFLKLNEWISWLIENGAEIDRLDKLERTPLQLAENHLKALKNNELNEEYSRLLKAYDVKDWSAVGEIRRHSESILIRCIAELKHNGYAIFQYRHTMNFIKTNYKEDIDGKIKKYTVLINKYPHYKMAYIERSKCYESARNFDEAYQDMILFFQQQERAEEKLDEKVTSTARISQARIFKDLKVKKVEDFLQIVDDLKNMAINSHNYSFVSHAYYWIGILYTIPNQYCDFNLAISYFTKAIEIKEDSTFYYARGQVYSEKCKNTANNSESKEYTSKAIADFSKVLYLDHLFYSAYYFRSLVYRHYSKQFSHSLHEKKEYLEKAIADINVPINAVGNFSGCYLSRGCFYLDLYVLGRKEDKSSEDYLQLAMNDFNAEYNLSDNKLLIYFNLALVYYYRGDEANYTAYYEKAKALDPDFVLKEHHLFEDAEKELKKMNAGQAQQNDDATLLQPAVTLEVNKDNQPAPIAMATQAKEAPAITHHVDIQVETKDNIEKSLLHTQEKEKGNKEGHLTQNTATAVQDQPTDVSANAVSSPSFENTIQESVRPDTSFSTATPASTSLRKLQQFVTTETLLPKYNSAKFVSRANKTKKDNGRYLNCIQSLIDDLYQDDKEGIIENERALALLSKNMACTHYLKSMGKQNSDAELKSYKEWTKLLMIHSVRFLDAVTLHDLGRHLDVFDPNRKDYLPSSQTVDRSIEYIRMAEEIKKTSPPLAYERYLYALVEILYFGNSYSIGASEHNLADLAETIAEQFANAGEQIKWRSCALEHYKRALYAYNKISVGNEDLRADAIKNDHINRARSGIKRLLILQFIPTEISNQNVGSVFVTMQQTQPAKTADNNTHPRRDEQDPIEIKMPAAKGMDPQPLAVTLMPTGPRSIYTSHLLFWQQQQSSSADMFLPNYNAQKYIQRAKMPSCTYAMRYIYNIEALVENLYLNNQTGILSAEENLAWLSQILARECFSNYENSRMRNNTLMAAEYLLTYIDSVIAYKTHSGRAMDAAVLEKTRMKKLDFDVFSEDKKNYLPSRQTVDRSGDFIKKSENVPPAHAYRLGLFALVEVLYLGDCLQIGLAEDNLAFQAEKIASGFVQNAMFATTHEERNKNLQEKNKWQRCALEHYKRALHTYKKTTRGNGPQPTEHLIQKATQNIKEMFWVCAMQKNTRDANPPQENTSPYLIGWH